MATYYDLIMRCPACISAGLDGGTPGPWYHADCGAPLRIGDDAHIRCTANCPASHVRYWRYACAAHESHYRAAASAHVASAVSTAGQITSLAGRNWLLTFLQNLGDW